MEKGFFVLRVIRGRGRKVESIINRKVKVFDLEDSVVKVVRNKDFEEYLFVEMVVNSKVMGIFKGIDGCLGFLKNEDGILSMGENEMLRMEVELGLN